MTGSDFVNKRGIRPRAFMGWSRKITVGWFNGYIFNTDHATYVSTSWSTWAARNGSGGPANNISQAIGWRRIPLPRRQGA